MKLVATDQPTLLILPQIQFALPIGWQVKCPSNIAIIFVQCTGHGVKVSDPIF